MGVNTKLTLEWEGKDYSVSMDMRKIDGLEEEINLMAMMNRTLANDIRFSHAAHLVSLVLNLAGAETTQESVYFGMFEGESQVQPLDLVNMTTTILDACFYKSKKNISES